MQIPHEDSPANFLYLFCFDFQKINGGIKNFEKYTSGQTLVGHGVRGDANCQLYCQVGPDSCRRGARRQEP
jgi:hypothetical protein